MEYKNLLPNEAFGLVLKELRAKHKTSQQKLAFDSELDRTFISLLERGHRQPTLNTLFQIANALDIKPSELIEAVEEKL